MAPPETVPTVNDALSRTELPGNVCSPPAVLVQALAVLKKDVRAELRTRAALNAVVLFSFTSLVVIAFATRGIVGGTVGQAALLWVLLFFAAFAGLAHVFLHEEEVGTSLTLQSAAHPQAVFIGKLLFNLGLLYGIALFLVPVYCLMLEVGMPRPLLFAVVVASGLLALGAAATIVAAIIARARGKNALFGALGFPILLPMLMIASRATERAIGEGSSAEASAGAIGLAAYGIMLIVAGGLSFPYVWED